jgi:NRAMP (natural resistance-associated macrophage protein)-like metal ion transporter
MKHRAAKSAAEDDEERQRESAEGANDEQPQWRRYVAALGPGLVTGSSDDDPSGIATYAQAGAQFRYATLWTVVVSFPMMVAVQEICDRTALATGDSLGRLVRVKFAKTPRTVIAFLLVALLVANGLNIAADLSAVGQGAALLGAGPAPLWTAITGVAIFALVARGSFDMISRVFKWLCISLLTYVAVLFAADVSWVEVGRGLFGAQFEMSADYWKLVVAILGTTISPYLFFWQSVHRVEQLREEDLGGGRAPALDERPRPEAKRKLQMSRIDVFTGMLLSQMVMFAIIAATAATLGAKQATTINSAADAAKVLEPVAGGLSTALFAVGFMGAGFLAVPVLAGSGAAGLSGLLNKEWGFDHSPRKAPLFYVLVGLGTVGGTLLGVFYSDPIGLLVFSALVNGVTAAPFLIVIMLISGDSKIMGRHRNGKVATILGWTTVVIMSVASVVGVWLTIGG